MKVSFATQGAATPRLIVRVVEQDTLPSGLDAGVADAARASRFAGKLGQTFESFSGGGGDLRRNVLVGLGDPTGEGRLAAFERAGAAVTANGGVAYQLNPEAAANQAANDAGTAGVVGPASKGAAVLRAQILLDRANFAPDAPSASSVLPVTP